MKLLLTVGDHPICALMSLPLASKIRFMEESMESDSYLLDFPWANCSCSKDPESFMQGLPVSSHYHQIMFPATTSVQHSIRRLRQ